MSDKKKSARPEDSRRARPELPNSRRVARSGRLANSAAAPVAAKKPHRFTYHGITVEDPYHWLKDPAYPEVKDAEVLGYLEAENAYFESTMKPQQALIDQIFEEFKGRQKLDDEGVPYRYRGYYYDWRFAGEDEYRTYLRWPVDANDAVKAGDRSRVQEMLNGPALAEGLEYFSLGGMAVSPDGRYLAWSSDTDGSERFVMRIKDLESGEALAEEIPETISQPVWSSDSSMVLYLVVNESWRPFEVRAHRLGTPVSEDTVVYHEDEESFFVGVGSTQSEKYLVIGTGDHVTSEVRVVPAAQPLAEPTLIAARRTRHEYEIDHARGRFWIRTNDHHKNFRVVWAPEDDPVEANWQELIAGTDEHYIRDVTSFENLLVIRERIDGLDQVRLRDYAGNESYIEFPEAAYTVGLGANEEPEAHALRLHYQSMVTPDTVFDYAVDKGSFETLKVQEIPSGYDASRYETVRLMAPARDGASVPVSVVYGRDFEKNGQGLLYLYAYGAYGSAVPPSFSELRLSLLDRGFAYAIAHVRGGDDLGYHWYEEGKLEQRANTFNDFIDVARYLVGEGYTAPGRIAILGGSAGGELMGAAVTQAPELWGAVILAVPFVDVLNTMLDDSLPLTPSEWPEWGNPIESKEAFELIRAYSPYDRLEARDYPPMLVTAGLNDPRVTYWEPAKWVAKVRALKSDDNVVLLKTNMGAGHQGRTGRFRGLYEHAEEYAFILAALDVGASSDSTKLK